MPVTPEYEWTSTESLPLMTEACNQHATRAYKAFFPSRYPIKAIPVGNENAVDRARAERVSKHLAWQLLVKNRTYKKDKRRLLLSTAINGSSFTKVYYRDKVHVDNIRAEDFVVPFGTGPRNLDQVHRKSHLLYPTVMDTQFLAQDGFLLHPAEVYYQGDSRETSEANEEQEGGRRSDTLPNDLQEAFVIEQHRWLRLDSRDSLPSPYIVWVDRQDRSVLRIQERWDDGGQPIEQFVHWPFLENPDGFYGLGMGHIIAQLNKAANMLLRQSIDAGTLATIGNHSGFINEAVSPMGGETFFELGKFQKIQFGGDDLRKGIFTFNFPGPNQVVLDLLQLMLSRSDRLATVTEAITGQTEKVMQPTTVLALIEQSLEQFTAIQEGQIEAWGDELQLVYNLNSQYMDPVEYFTILDAGGEYQDNQIARADYEQDLQIVPVADPKQTTEQQRLAKAQSELEFARTSPLVAQNPGSLYEFERSFLESIQAEDIERKFPPPGNQPPPREDNAETENALALKATPQVPPPHPDQNHQEHIFSHVQFLNGYNGVMTPEGKKAMEGHIQEHRSMLYQQEQNGQAGSGRTGNMAGQSGNGMVPGGIAQQA